MRTFVRIWSYVSVLDGNTHTLFALFVSSVKFMRVSFLCSGFYRELSPTLIVLYLHVLLILIDNVRTSIAYKVKLNKGFLRMNRFFDIFN